MSPSAKRIGRIVLHVVLAILGGVALVILVRHVGAAALAEVLRTLAPFIVVAALLEGARIAADALRTRLCYDAAGVSVPFLTVLSAQMRAYPFGLFLPAGGAASEAFKAAVMTPRVGGSVAAAVASHNQSLVLFGGFVVSIPAFVAAWAAWGSHPMTIAIGVQALSGIGLGLGIALVTRVQVLGRLVARVSRRAGTAVAAYQAAVVRLSLFAPGPILAAVLARACQLGQVTVLGVGIGLAFSPTTPLLLFGPHLVGTAAGDLVPGQIGALDGAFAFAADALGVTRAAAMSIPIALHIAQIVWGIVGVVAGVFARRSAARANDEPSARRPATIPAAEAK